MGCRRVVVRYDERMRLLVLAAVLALAACTHPAGPATPAAVDFDRKTSFEGQLYPGLRVVFQGNDHAPAAELARDLDVVHGVVTKDGLARDAMVVQGWYWDHGYVEVAVTQVARVEQGRVVVTFTVREGVQYRLGALEAYEEIGGARSTPLGWAPTLKPGDVFSRRALRTALSGVERTYRDLGHAFVEVLPVSKIDRERRLVDLSVPVVRGPLVHFHEIRVSGLSKIAPGPVLAEVQVKVGDLYSETKLEVSRQRLIDTGWFLRVDFAVAQAPKADEIDLVIEVAERPEGTGAPTASGPAETSTARPFWAILATP